MNAFHRDVTMPRGGLSGRMAALRDSVRRDHLLAPLHPMHFLYAKFHADVSPLGGHDGGLKAHPHD